MPVGLQVFNESGVFQIDGATKNYILDRVVTCTTSILVGDRVVTSQGNITLNSGEMLAVRSEKPCGVFSVNANTVYMRISGAVGSTATCYIFKPIEFSDATYGLQVFNEAGEIVFCAAKKPLRLAGVTSGTGVTNYTPDRIYAAVLINQYYNIQSDRVFLGGTTVRDTIVTYRSMVTTPGYGISVTNENEFWSVSQYTAPTPPGLPPNTTSIAQAAFAVVDVTNY